MVKSGDHISWKRGLFFRHHAIVSGVHTDSLRIIHNLESKGVVEDTVKIVEVREPEIKTCKSENHVKEVIARARYCIGQNEYNKVWNNSEHFAKKCMEIGLVVSEVQLGDHINYEQRGRSSCDAIVSEVLDDRFRVIHFDRTTGKEAGIVEAIVLKRDIEKAIIMEHCTSPNHVKEVIALAMARMGEKDDAFAKKCITEGSIWSEVKVGDHIVMTTERIYSHHAIVLGEYEDGRHIDIIHNYAKAGIVYETWKKSDIGILKIMSSPSEEAVELVISRAKCHVGLQAYDILNNNCEHFATMCITGTPSSSQARNVKIVRTVMYMGGAGLIAGGLIVGTAGILVLGPLGIGIGVALGGGGASVIAGNVGVQIAMETGRVVNMSNKASAVPSGSSQVETGKRSVNESSVNESSVNESSVNESSVHESSVNESRVNDSSVNESNVNESSVSESSVSESSVHESSVNESIVNESRVNESSVNESSVNESSVNESSVSESSVSESNIEEVSTSSGSCESFVVLDVEYLDKEEDIEHISDGEVELATAAT